MKLILSFVIITTALSADTCYKLGLGNAALTPAKLCTPVNSMTPAIPIKCDPTTPVIETQNTIKCNLPTPTPTPAPVVTKCAPVKVECPIHTAPVIETGGNKCPTTPTDPHTSSATPEPASYALLGGGLITAGLARRLRKKA